MIIETKVIKMSYFLGLIICVGPRHSKYHQYVLNLYLSANARLPDLRMGGTPTRTPRPFPARGETVFCLGDSQWCRDRCQFWSQFRPRKPDAWKLGTVLPKVGDIISPLDSFQRKLFVGKLVWFTSETIIQNGSWKHKQSAKFWFWRKFLIPFQRQPGTGEELSVWNNREDRHAFGPSRRCSCWQ